MTAAPATAARLRVLTYNVHRGRGVDGRFDLERIADVIVGAEPDVVALQELGDEAQAEALARRLDGTAAFASGSRPPQGVAILSRAPILEAHPVQRASWSSAPQLRHHSGGALAARLHWGSRPITVVNAHLSWIRPERTRQVQALLDEIATVEGDLVLCGGLGRAPRSPSLRAAAPSAETWPAPLPMLGLDHVLYRGELTLIDAGPVQDGAARWASDHLPVLASFERAS